MRVLNCVLHRIRALLGPRDLKAAARRHQQALDRLDAALREAIER